MGLIFAIIFAVASPLFVWSVLGNYTENINNAERASQTLGSFTKFYTPIPTKVISQQQIYKKNAIAAPTPTLMPVVIQEASNLILCSIGDKTYRLTKEMCERSSESLSVPTSTPYVAPTTAILPTTIYSPPEDNSMQVFKANCYKTVEQTYNAVLSSCISSGTDRATCESIHSPDYQSNVAICNRY